MLTRKLLLLPLIAATPLALYADANSDRRIEATAQSSYTFRRVLNNDIEVKVRDGVATLTGRVRDLDQSRLAEDTVANIEGVRRVENEIKLDPKARGASDEWLTVKIRSKLLLERDISLMHTKVDVKEGVVTLTGTADSDEQKLRTESAIKEIVGVRQVRNLLEVVERTAAAGRRNAEPDRRDEPLPPGVGLPTGRVTRIEDAAITTQIKFQLLTNDDTSGLKTKIDADDGRVVITGEAESDAQRQLVTELARRVRGVSQVENRMSVKSR